MEFGQSVQFLVIWLVIAVIITVNSNPVNPENSVMTSCSCGPGETSLEMQVCMIQNLNKSAQDALRFYQESNFLSSRTYRNFVNKRTVVLRLPEAGTAADLGAMQDTNIDCLTKVMQIVALMDNEVNENFSDIRNREELRQKLQRIRSRTCDSYCRLTGSRTSSSAPPMACILSLEGCSGKHCTDIIRLRDISKIAFEMKQRYESLGVRNCSN